MTIMGFNQVKLEDLFLAQCFKLCYLETKAKVFSIVGKNLNDLEKRLRAELTYRIETYFD